MSKDEQSGALKFTHNKSWKVNRMVNISCNAFPQSCQVKNNNPESFFHLYKSILNRSSIVNILHEHEYWIVSSNWLFFFGQKSIIDEVLRTNDVVHSVCGHFRQCCSSLQTSVTCPTAKRKWWAVCMYKMSAQLYFVQIENSNPIQKCAFWKSP